MVYKWTMDIHGIDANAAGKELERIEQKYNGMDAKMVVQESIDSGAVLHDCFEWDNDKAADQFREVQAKEIIRHLVVAENVSTNTGQRNVETRAFVSVKSDEEKHKKKYISLESAMSDEYYKQQLIMQALYELRAFKQKYRDLMVFKSIFEAIEEIAV